MVDRRDKEMLLGQVRALLRVAATAAAVAVQTGGGGGGGGPPAGTCACGAARSPNCRPLNTALPSLRLHQAPLFVAVRCGSAWVWGRAPPACPRLTAAALPRRWPPPPAARLHPVVHRPERQRQVYSGLHPGAPAARARPLHRAAGWRQHSARAEQGPGLQVCGGPGCCIAARGCVHCVRREEESHAVAGLQAADGRTTAAAVSQPLLTTEPTAAALPVCCSQPSAHVTVPPCAPPQPHPPPTPPAAPRTAPRTFGASARWPSCSPRPAASRSPHSSRPTGLTATLCASAAAQVR